MTEPSYQSKPSHSVGVSASTPRRVVRGAALEPQKIAEAQIRNVVVCHLSGWSLRICFSFNAGQWVARPVCPAAQAANFGLLDLQLTEADRRPFKLPPAQLGELPIEPAEERLSSLRVASIAVAPTLVIVKP